VKSIVQYKFKDAERMASEAGGEGARGGQFWIWIVSVSYIPFYRNFCWFLSTAVGDDASCKRIEICVV
jgi:hypothetical protein